MRIVLPATTSETRGAVASVVLILLWVGAAAMGACVRSEPAPASAALTPPAQAAATESAKSKPAETPAEQPAAQPATMPQPKSAPGVVASPTKAPTNEVFNTSSDPKEPWLNLRTGDDPKSPIVAQLRDGTPLRTITTTGRLWEVEVVDGPDKGKRGFAGSKWIRPIGGQAVAGLTTAANAVLAALADETIFADDGSLAFEKSSYFKSVVGAGLPLRFMVQYEDMSDGESPEAGKPKTFEIKSTADWATLSHAWTQFGRGGNVGSCSPTCCAISYESSMRNTNTAYATSICFERSLPDGQPAVSTVSVFVGG